MFADIANEFQTITKFNLLNFFTGCRDFFQDDYNDVYNYYAGREESVDAMKLKNLDNLISDARDLIRIFQTFAGKLGNVGYWELQQYCQDLKDTLERIAKFPKYLRTAKTCRGYKPYIQVSEDIGGLRSSQDISESLGNITEQELILNNDLEEGDWEIDTLSQVTALVDNANDLVVDTILEQPIGRKIYGRDIGRKITFEGNDVEVKEYEENVEQKCDILLELNKGDVPEMPTFGKNLVSGGSLGKYNYTQFMSDVEEVFLQDPLFQSVSVRDIGYEAGDIYAVCDIRTKYDYATVKSVKIR